MAEVSGFHATHCPGCERPYGPNRVVMGWRPCDCPGAGPAGGHITARCRQCDHLYVEGHIGGEPEPDRMPNFGQA